MKGQKRKNANILVADGVIAELGTLVLVNKLAHRIIGSCLPVAQLANDARVIMFHHRGRDLGDVFIDDSPLALNTVTLWCDG